MHATTRLFPWLLFFVATTLVAQQDRSQWSMKVDTWTGEAPPGTRVSITNEHGAFKMKGGGIDAVEIHANVQRHVDDPRIPAIKVTNGDGVLAIEIVYPDDAPLPDPIPDSWRKRRVDVTAYVPATAPLTLRTLHGNAKITGMQAPIEATSESGELRISTSGWVHARSNHGDVFADLPRPPWSQAPRLESITGSLTVHLPWDAAPHAEIETRGEITSDYSIDIAWQPDSILKRGSVRFGAAEHRLDLVSNRGNVRLLRNAPLPAVPAETKSANDR